ncbi:MAG TPA: peptide-binding protein [Methylosinus sp.]
MCRISILFVAFLLLAFAPSDARQSRAKAPGDGAVPFTLDAGRILLEIELQRPGGGMRRALAWFNMGMSAPVLTAALYRELQIDRGQPLRISVAGVTLEAAADEVTDGDGGLAAPSFAHLFAPLPVEAMLPASLLRDRRLVLDYRQRLFAIARSDDVGPEGVAVPISLDEKTGFASVTAMVAGEPAAFVLDAGAGYSWMRGAVLRRWLEAHPDWRRADGAVGLANNNMLDFAFERDGVVGRLPEIAIGPLSVKNVGMLGTAPALGALDGLFGDFFWDNWQKSATGPVVGWLGGNVLGNFQLTIDYPARMSYWRARADPDPHDLDQIGVTLIRREARYFIGGVIRPSGHAPDAALAEVAPGDELIAVGGLDARGAGKAALLAALAGKPGETRHLRLERDGRAFETTATVLDLH